MHDFCFTLPYGVLLIFGGLFGFLRKGSIPSLAGGVGCGLLLCLAGYIQLSAYHVQRNNYFAIVLQLGISLLLTGVLGHRCYNTGKFMPAGLVAGISGIMTLFYLYKIATSGNHFTKKVSTE